MIDKKTENSINLLIKKLKDENLGSLKFSNKNISIEISNNLGSVQIAQNPISSQPHNTINSSANDTSNMQSIDSPMVGIIYLTPKPSSPPFVKNGQKIKKGDTICLIEAMKTFNEIKSDKDGVVKSILIKNGEAVEFGQPLFEIS
ncbi:MAG: acetyl-CoA carboxylase biotin carboxyl carrier protein [Alphaproteobacteria bacterium]|jgi:acetyl-CoA carboxylase biotin carboxyl carrier protein